MTLSNSVRATVVEANEISRETGISADAVLFALNLVETRRLQAEVSALKEAQAAPPRFADGPAGIIVVIEVTLAGDESQGPVVPVPRGYPVTIRQRFHSGTHTGYFAFSRAGLGQTGTRSEWRDNDGLSVHVSSLDRLWFSADTDATFFEILVEFGP
jgi:hypothetical protein